MYHTGTERCDPRQPHQNVEGDDEQAGCKPACLRARDLHSA